MSKFRKKPVVIDAVQFTVEASKSQFDFPFVFGEPGLESRVSFIVHKNGTGEKCILIETLEGVMTASPGDWIIRGVNGEFYPCKPDIFEKSYEAA